MWRYWTIGIGGIVVAIIQQLGFPASFKQLITAAFGIGLALLGFWLLAEEREKRNNSNSTV